MNSLPTATPDHTALSSDERREFLPSLGSEHKDQSLAMLNNELEMLEGMLSATKETSAKLKSFGYSDPSGIFQKDAGVLEGYTKKVKELIAEVEAL